MKLNFSPILGALCVALALQGCSKSDNGSASGGSTTASNGSTAAAPAGKQYKLAFVCNNPATFWTIARRVAQRTPRNNSEMWIGGFSHSLGWTSG